jgi:hypothetical protein
LRNDREPGLLAHTEAEGKEMSMEHVCPRCEKLEQAITANDEEMQRMASKMEAESAAFKETLDGVMKGKDQAWSEVLGSERLKHNARVAELETALRAVGESIENEDPDEALAIIKHTFAQGAQPMWDRDHLK